MPNIPKFLALCHTFRPGGDALFQSTLNDAQERRHKNLNLNNHAVTIIDQVWIDLNYYHYQLSHRFDEINGIIFISLMLRVGKSLDTEIEAL
jgi:hypothetical protein